MHRSSLNFSVVCFCNTTVVCGMGDMATVWKPVPLNAAVSLPSFSYFRSVKMELGTFPPRVPVSPALGISRCFSVSKAVAT